MIMPSQGQGKEPNPAKAKGTSEKPDNHEASGKNVKAAPTPQKVPAPDVKAAKAAEEAAIQEEAAATAKAERKAARKAAKAAKAAEDAAMQQEAAAAAKAERKAARKAAKAIEEAEKVPAIAEEEEAPAKPVKEAGPPEAKVRVEQLIRGECKNAACIDVFICGICHVHIAGCKPKFCTWCSHLFCGDCLDQWFCSHQTNKSSAQRAQSAGEQRSAPCPVCKTQLQEDESLISVSPTCDDENAMPSDMLSQFKVACANHSTVRSDGKCCWTGEYTSYNDHFQKCKNEEFPVELPVVAGDVASSAPATAEDTEVPLPKAQPEAEDSWVSEVLPKAKAQPEPRGLVEDARDDSDGGGEDAEVAAGESKVPDPVAPAQSSKPSSPSPAKSEQDKVEAAAIDPVPVAAEQNTRQEVKEEGVFGRLWKKVKTVSSILPRTDSAAPIRAGGPEAQIKKCVEADMAPTTSGEPNVGPCKKGKKAPRSPERKSSKRSREKTEAEAVVVSEPNGTNKDNGEDVASTKRFRHTKETLPEDKRRPKADEKHLKVEEETKKAVQAASSERVVRWKCKTPGCTAQSHKVIYMDEPHPKRLKYGHKQLKAHKEAEAKAAPKPKAKAAAKAADSHESSDDTPAPKPKAKAAVKVADPDDSSDDAPAPKPKAKAVATAAASNDSSDDAAAPKPKAKPAADSESDDEMLAAVP